MSLEERMTDLNRKAHRAAFIFYTRKGFVPQALKDIVNATSSMDAFRKYSPDQPRVPAGCPEGGQWCEGNDGDSKYPPSKVKSKKDAENIVDDRNGRPYGNGQCAALTHALAPDLPAASAWEPGDLVQGNQDIPVGTPVATFNFQGDPGTNGYGPSYSPGGLSGQSHTGIYLGQSIDGMEILDQFPAGNGPRIETIPWNLWNNSPNEAGSRYYTIAY
jgi:hypothetical protein